jgi:uncharacterized protein with von Willebrand factor type A (vWA) domain
MFIRLFFMLRESGVPVAITELLTLHAALQANVARDSVDDFYSLARACLVKDERHYDRFDRTFANYLNGIEQVFKEFDGEIPEEWLRIAAQKLLTDEERAKIQALGGWAKLMETLQERLREQKKRHEGGSKWIGTGGTSPFGTGGFNPEGVSIGKKDKERGQGRAVKIWEAREYRNLDDGIELNTRNVKVALRKLRRFAREGAADNFDLDGTISATARNAGLLDLKFIPERHNAIKVLLFLDVGGSMDGHVRICEELFSAARSEFKHLEYFYFHNFIYESVWKDNRRRHAERTSVLEVMRTFGHDYKLIIVGDASMSPYEILEPGGSIEHMNEEPGAVWLKRLTKTWPRHVWLNPEPKEYWDRTRSIAVTRELVEDRMFALTLDGLDRAIKALH